MKENQGLVSGEMKDEDRQEFSLRPQSFAEYIGQDDLKNNLRVFINSAKKRNEVLDHVLLYGPPGLGKTTMANIIAKELNCTLRSTSGRSLRSKGT